MLRCNMHCHIIACIIEKEENQDIIKRSGKYRIYALVTHSAKEESKLLLFNLECIVFRAETRQEI